MHRMLVLHGHCDKVAEKHDAADRANAAVVAANIRGASDGQYNSVKIADAVRLCRLAGLDCADQTYHLIPVPFHPACPECLKGGKNETQ
jgi:hypothetical protein